MELNSSESFCPHIPYDARLFYVTNGRAEIIVNGKSIFMNTSDVLLITAGVKYHIKTSKNYVKYTIFNFDCTQNHSYIKIPVPPALQKSLLTKNITEYTNIEDFEAMNSYVYIQSVDVIHK